MSPRILPFEKPIAWIVTILAAISTTGCLDSGPGKIKPIEVDPQAMAQSLFELCDANQDASLTEEELAAEPALAGSFKSLDTDGDGKLSLDETAANLQSMFTGTSLMGVECRVSLNGQPLREAVVKLTPATCFGESLHSAEGISDESGIARPTIAAEFIPQNLQSAPLVSPGIYRVEISHPKVSLPARYNTATELGIVVTPTQRGGDTATFALQGK